VIDWVLNKVGVSKETALIVKDAAVSAATTVGRDLITDAFGQIARQQVTAQIEGFVRPQFEQMRAMLLERVAGEPPPGFGARLRLRGYDKITDSQISDLWADVVASIAEQPAAPAQTEDVA